MEACVSNPLPRHRLTGSACRALRPLEGYRDHRATPSACRASPASRPPHPQRRRPVATGCGCTSTPAGLPRGLAGHSRHPAALAPTTHRSSLDPTITLPRAAIDRPRDPTARPPFGSREPHVGLPANPGRAEPTRTPSRSFHRLADPQHPRHRACANAFEPYLDSVPPFPSCRRLRFRHDRLRIPTPLLSLVLHRHSLPQSVPRWHHHEPNGRSDHPGSPKPLPPLRRPGRFVPGPDP